MNVYEKWMHFNDQIKMLQKEKLSLEVELFKKHQEQLKAKPAGVTKIEMPELFLSVTQGYSYKVDQDMADVLQKGFRKEYKLDKTAYKKLSPEDRSQVDEALTISVRKPTFKVERYED